MKLEDGLHQSQPLADEENLSAFGVLVLEALGQERLSKLSKKQSGLLNRALARLFYSKSVNAITLDEIVGCYKIVTEHISPLWMEAVVNEWNKHQKMN
jgi:hypothetical protein